MLAFKQIFKYSLPVFLAVEALSFVGYLEPRIGTYAFLAIVAAASAVSFRRLDLGLLVLSAELFIGSKGYLFFLEIDSFKISIRMALWLIVMISWLYQVMLTAVKEKKISLPVMGSAIFPYFSAVAAFFIWGLLNAFIKGNAQGDIFSDANGWLYFALAFPVYHAFRADRDNRLALKAVEVMTAAAFWLSLKTFFLLFVFSHSFPWTYGIYRWVRQTGVGEITSMPDGFFRIFIQSQIFILAAFIFIATAFIFYEGRFGRRDLRNHILIGSAYLSVLFISMSRSFWVGLATALAVLSVYAFRTRPIGRYLLWLGSLAVMALLGIALLFSAVRFPFPRPLSDFNASILSDRALQVSGEAGASSRWALLPELRKKISASPLLGSGFGSTVTYLTRDPRILEARPSGEYTTYAFEWGWLDIWIKTGLFGLLAYIFLIGRIIFLAVKNQEFLSLALGVGLIAISAVSFFSPYSNHPLGIGYLLLAAVIVEKIPRK